MCKGEALPHRLGQMQRASAPIFINGEFFTMSRIILVISILILAPQTVLAQAHTRRVEAFVALGRHVILNQSFSKNDSRYTAGYLLYNFSETQSIGVRFGKIAYESPLSLVEWLATHRYSWRKDDPCGFISRLE